MNGAGRQGRTDLGAAMGAAFQSGWQRLTADDQHEPDVERLAAYADGRLTEADQQAVAQEIAESPVAFELLVALMDEHAAGGRLPSADRAEHVLKAPTPPAIERGRRRTQVAAWAIAASLLAAAWGVVRSQNLKNEVAALSHRADEAAAALVISEKERLAELPAEDRLPFLLGRSSPELAEVAVADFGDLLSGDGSRGAEPPTDAESAALRARREGLAWAASLFDRASVRGQLEYAAALIQAGERRHALALLEQLEQSANETDETAAAWANLRGGLYALEAAEAPVSQAAPLWTQAEALLRRAAGQGLRDAWLNLALTLAAQDKRRGALEAAERYLEGESSPQVREDLRRLMGM